MYPEDMVAPMREELTQVGVQEIREANKIKDAIEAEGSALVVINSVCGCAAGNARPAVRAAAKHGKKPDRMITAFAGNDKEAVDQARSMMVPFPPSSPSMALFKDGKLVHMLERHHIEGRPAEMIAENLMQAFDEYC